MAKRRVAARPSVFIGWPSVGVLRLVVESDGVCFRCAGVGAAHDPQAALDEELVEVERAVAWGRDPRRPVPSGWRVLDLPYTAGGTQ